MSATKTELSSPRGVEQQLQADQSRLAVPPAPPIGEHHEHYTFIIARKKK